MVRKLMLAQLTFSLALAFALYVHPTPTAQDQAPQQSINQPADSQSALSHLRSPYKIAEYINEHNDEADLDGIWEMFRITAESGKPGRCGCRGDDCNGICKAEVINIGPGGGEAGYAILRICYAGDMLCRFLLFKNESGWEYVGIAESLWGKYKPPQHRIVSSGDNHWLILKAGTGGTGVLDYVEQWFEISGGGLKEVLSYPVSGHSVQGAAEDYKFKSRVVSRIDDGHYVVAIEYKVFGKPIYQPDLRWTASKRERLYFRWNESGREFFLDKDRSRFTESKDARIYDWLIQQGYLK